MPKIISYNMMHIMFSNEILYLYSKIVFTKTGNNPKQGQTIRNHPKPPANNHKPTANNHKPTVMGNEQSLKTWTILVVTIIFIMFWDFLIFYQVFLSPQVKRCAIITYIHGIYELQHELSNDLTLTILGNYEISGNCLNSIEW